MPIDSLLESSVEKPSPSLTAQMVWREVMRDEIGALEKLSNQRMDAIERSVLQEVAKSSSERSHLHDLLKCQLATHEEKFRAMRIQHEERVKAVDQAFDFAKEFVHEQNVASDRAISKSEVTTAKQIDQQGALIRAMKDNFLTAIDDLKERIGRIESVDRGRAEQRTTQREDIKQMSALAGLAFSVAGTIAGFLISYIVRR